MSDLNWLEKIWFSQNQHLFKDKEKEMPVVSNFDELIKVSHEMAVEKGWWPEGKKRSVTEIFANFHSELSEAWEEYRRGRMFPWHDPVDNDNGRSVYTYEDIGNFPAGPKPEGFTVELADFLIRLADWCGSLGVNSLEKRNEDIKPDYKIDPADMVMFLHTTTSNLFEIAGGIDSGDVVIEELIAIFSSEVTDRVKADLEKRKQDIVSMSVSRAVHVCLNQVESFMCNDNLWKVVNLKLFFNQSREFRHGNLNA